MSILTGRQLFVFYTRSNNSPPTGCFASTVGRDEQVIREYIRHQEAGDRRIDQLPLI